MNLGRQYKSVVIIYQSVNFTLFRPAGRDQLDFQTVPGTSVLYSDLLKPAKREGASPNASDSQKAGLRTGPMS